MSKDNAEVLTKLDGLTTLVVTEFKAVAAEFKALRADLAAQGERIARMEGRLDEQSRILAAMIPTTLAAVPVGRSSAPPTAAE